MQAEVIGSSTEVLRIVTEYNDDAIIVFILTGAMILLYFLPISAQC